MRIESIRYGVLNIGNSMGKPCIDIKLWAPDVSITYSNVSPLEVCNQIVEMSYGNPLVIRLTCELDTMINQSAIVDIINECKHQNIAIESVVIETDFRYELEFNPKLLKNIDVSVSGSVLLSTYTEHQQSVIDSMKLFNMTNICVLMSNARDDELAKFIESNKHANIYLFGHIQSTPYISLAMKHGIKVLS